MNDKRLNGKVAVITGVSKGLGKAMALSLARAGARLFLISRNATLLNETAREARDLGAEAVVFVADVTDEEQVQRAAAAATEKFGKVQVLINNAGVNLRKPVTEFSLAEWRHVLDSNLTSVFLMCRAFVPLMKGQGYGRIFNLTSTMSHVALPGRAVYAASKTGLLGFTRAVALELAPEKITVVAISPGPFATEMNAPLMQNPEINREFMSRTPLGRWGKMEEIGELAVYLCSEAADFITGTDILVDGGWTAQ